MSVVTLFFWLLRALLLWLLSRRFALLDDGYVMKERTCCLRYAGVMWYGLCIWTLVAGSLAVVVTWYDEFENYYGIKLLLDLGIVNVSCPQYDKYRRSRMVERDKRVPPESDPQRTPAIQSPVATYMKEAKYTLKHREPKNAVQSLHRLTAHVSGIRQSRPPPVTHPW
jgi:hypothetical protein